MTIKEKTITSVRIILSLLLIYGVYTETGIWTTIAVGLFFVDSEISLLAVKYEEED